MDSPLLGLDGRDHTRINGQGTLGRSANGVAPLRAPDGTVIGEVSAGLLESLVSADLRRQLPTLLLYAGLALAVGVGASLLLARRLKRRTFGLELDEIAELLQEREAMLHGIREGVVTLDPNDRVSLLNDEARCLLEWDADVIGQPLGALIPPGRLLDLLTGAAGVGADGSLLEDRTVLTDSRCLTVTRRPVSRGGRSIGAVVTLQDRTEQVTLLRELDSIRALTDALRAQQHEHANRVHSLVGLLELGRADEASAYLAEISGAGGALAERLWDLLGSPALVALLLAKVTIAAERGVELDIDADGVDGVTAADLALDERSLLTVLGNLIDNALDAVGGRAGGRIGVSVRRDGDALLVDVRDNGPGVREHAERVFVDGFSTKPVRDGVHRGLGLALVRRLVTRAHGTVGVRDEGGARFRVRIPLAGAGAGVGVGVGVGVGADGAPASPAGTAALMLRESPLGVRD